jgi:hypothetical protein
MAPQHLQLSGRPLAVSRVPARGRANGSFGRVLIGLALGAGIGVTLYRNDLVHDAALAVHQDALYSRVEAALGGPAFGTLRGLEQFAAATATSLTLTERISVPRSPDASSTPAPIATAPVPPIVAGNAPPVVSLESLAREKKPVTTNLKMEAMTPLRSAPTSKARAAEKSQPVSQKSDAPLSERERLNAAIGNSMLGAPAETKAGAKAKSGK